MMIPVPKSGMLRKSARPGSSRKNSRHRIHYHLLPPTRLRDRLAGRQQLLRFHFLQSRNARSRRSSITHSPRQTKFHPNPPPTGKTPNHRPRSNLELKLLQRRLVAAPAFMRRRSASALRKKRCYPFLFMCDPERSEGSAFVSAVAFFFVAAPLAAHAQSSKPRVLLDRIDEAMRCLSPASSCRRSRRCS